MFINRWLRSYQLDWLLDVGTRKISLKSRQVGMSDAIALEMVLLSSGLLSLFNPITDSYIKTDDCNIVSKKEEDAKDVIKKAKKWVEVLRMVKVFRPFLSTENKDSEWTKHAIRFDWSRKGITSHAQAPEAARGKTGHLYLDEFAFYAWQSEIWLGAVPSVESNVNLRVVIISTPNGTSDQFYQIWNDEVRFSAYSRHQVSIYDAIAAGYPADVEQIKREKTPDAFEQENNCAFVGATGDFFSLELINSAYHEQPGDVGGMVLLGIDVASAVDMTAVQVMRVDGQTMWLEDTYILSGGLTYESNFEAGSFRVGQDRIVDAIIKHHQPKGIIIDVTGDKARQVVGWSNLYSLLRNMGHRRMEPVNVSQTYKVKWVNEMKGAMVAGRLKISDKRRDRVFSRKKTGQYREILLRHGVIPEHHVSEFLSDCFQTTDFDFLKRDYQLIYTEISASNNKPIIKTKREGGSHGDTFWASLFALNLAENKRLAKKAKRRVDYSEIQAPDYMGYL